MNRKFISFLIIAMLSGCMQQPSSSMIKMDHPQKKYSNRQQSIDSFQSYKDSFISQIVTQSDASFDSLLRKHFHYDSIVLSPIEKSMADAGLVNVLDVLPTVKIDLRYASEDNFVGEILYPSVTRCFLRIETILKLLKAYKYLHQIAPEYTFLIFDGARPQSVQYRMYEIAKAKEQTKYVASPAKGSLHNFGTAIDLSLYDIVEKKEVDMGTKFDFFGPEAQPRFHEMMLMVGKLTENQVKNRNLLKNVMKKGGFRSIQTEWWHFEAFDKNFVRANFKIIR